MIRINWDEVEAIKNQLLSKGATYALELVVIVFYHNKPDSDKIQIYLGQLEESLYQIGEDANVKSVFLYDITLKKPYLKCEEPDRVSALESVPNSGHPDVLAEFGKMSPEARDVWVEIAMSQQQHYVAGGA